MKRNFLVTVIITLIILISIILIVFQYQPSTDTIKEELIHDNEDIPISVGNHSFNNAVNTFTMNIFKEIIENTDENIFLSPYSVFTALAMTYEGAKKETAEEMSDVLNIDQDNASFHNYVKNLYTEFNKNNEHYTISTANALWTRQNLQLIETYKDIITEYYNGEITEVDFNNPQKAAEIINQWIEDKTNGLIKDLITPEHINPYIMLILTNAIYFNGIWRTQFDPVNTTDRDFTNYSGITVQIPTMSIINTKNVFNYTETDNLQILELPYSGDTLSMIIILPKNNDISTVTEEINDEKLNEWENSMVETNLDIYLPKFKVKTEYTLDEYLKSLGMNQSFSPSADFSGITTEWDLFIDRVLHKAYIEVNEEGTEAAAATSVNVAPTAIPEPSKIFNANHPFIFLIHHIDSGTILFIGRFSNPK
jgi:serpin B